MFALCLVQEVTVKMGFCHGSVQAASLVVEEQEVVGGTEADEWQATTEFGVCNVCLVCSGVVFLFISQNNEESAEWALPAFKCK